MTYKEIIKLQKYNKVDKFSSFYGPGKGIPYYYLEENTSTCFVGF